MFTWLRGVLAAPHGNFSAACGVFLAVHRFSSCGSRLRCSKPCEFLVLNQGSNPCALRCEAILNHRTSRECPIAKPKLNVPNPTSPQPDTPECLRTLQCLSEKWYGRVVTVDRGNCLNLLWLKTANFANSDDRVTSLGSFPAGTEI